MAKEKIPIIALDTSVAVYILQGVKSDNCESKCNLANQLFAERNYQFCLPSPVLAEILTVVKPKNRDKIKNEIYKNFDILNFHAHAAELAAQLFTTNQQIQFKEKENKARVKFDAQIVGISVSWALDGLCSYDENQCKRYNKLVKEIFKSSERKAGSPEDFIEQKLLSFKDSQNLKKNKK